MYWIIFGIISFILAIPPALMLLLLHIWLTCDDLPLDFRDNIEEIFMMNTISLEMQSDQIKIVLIMLALPYINILVYVTAITMYIIRK